MIDSVAPTEDTADAINDDGIKANNTTTTKTKGSEVKETFDDSDSVNSDSNDSDSDSDDFLDEPTVRMLKARPKLTHVELLLPAYTVPCTLYRHPPLLKSTRCLG